jgi:hypothetical protein
MDKVLGRYDAPAIRGLFEQAGVLGALAERGFAELEVVVDGAGRALPHTVLFGCKDGARFQLLDAMVVAATIGPDFFAARGGAMERPIELAVVYWLREEDPTVAFSAARPALPLQRHPGLGVLRRAFRVIVRMAGELGMDGVASVPKLFHDAIIFFRSRLFLFLDGAEQGRFEALARDLRALPLGDASLALVGGCVRDAAGAVVRWTPSFMVFPLSATLTAYLHSPEYVAQVARGLEQCRFTWEPAGVERTRALVRG